MTGGEPSTGVPVRGALALGPRGDLFLRITPQHTPLLVRLQSTDCFPWNEAPLRDRHWRHGSRGPLLPAPPPHQVRGPHLPQESNICPRLGAQNGEDNRIELNSQLCNLSELLNLSEPLSLDLFNGIAMMPLLPGGLWGLRSQCSKCSVNTCQQHNLLCGEAGGPGHLPPGLARVWPFPLEQVRTKADPVQGLKAPLLSPPKPQPNILYEAIYVVFWKRQNYRNKK